MDLTDFVRYWLVKMVINFIKLFRLLAYSHYHSMHVGDRGNILNNLGRAVQKIMQAYGKRSPRLDQENPFHEEKKRIGLSRKFLRVA